jgi:AcrR family transcriptional regulator
LPNLAVAPRPRRFTGLSAADRRLERRALLLDAALEVVGREGWRAVTVRAVLEGARLNPRYFYESFDDLDQLVVALYDRVVEQLGAAVWTALAAAGDAPADHLRAVVAAIVGFVDEDRRRGRVLYTEDLGNDALRRRRAETAGMVVAFVEDYAAERRAGTDSADPVGRVATSVLVGGFNQLLVDWLAGRVRASRDELVEDCTALFLALGDAAASVAAIHAREQRRR